MADLESYELFWLKFQIPAVTTALLLLLVTFGSLWWKVTKRLPPGPRGIPILGYLPFFSLRAPHLQLEEMKKKYGSVFGMYLGSNYTLFLCDLESSKEAFNMDDFSDRPPGAFHLSDHFSHMAAMNGQPWKEHRKLCAKSLRHLGVGTEILENLVRTEIKVGLDRLEKQATSNNSKVNFRDDLQLATTNILCAMLIGKTFAPDHPTYLTLARYLKYFAENGTPISLDQIFPKLRPYFKLFVPSKVIRQKLFSEVTDILWNEIESHDKNPEPDAKDFMSYYLRERNKPGNLNKFTKGDLNGNTQLLLFAGADTIRGSVEWFMLCMAKFPDVQEKAFQEIHDFLGANGTPRYTEKHQIPYAEAVILESMRYCTFAPINPLHCTLKDTKFRGWDVPAGATVLSCLYSVHMDSRIWKCPGEFRVEHFLAPDMKSVQVPESFVPFALGKRFCIGDKMALVETFLFGISILQRFRILPPDGGVRLDGNLRVNMECIYPTVKLVPR